MAKKRWISGAIEHPGAFSAKAKAAGKSTEQFAREHSGSPGKLGKQARLALTLMNMSQGKEEKKPRPSRTSVRYPAKRDEED